MDRGGSYGELKKGNAEEMERAAEILLQEAF